jgi:PLP dependent protein
MAPVVERASLDPDRVRDNLSRVRDRIASAGGDPDKVEICAATKYVAAKDLGILAEAGIELVGENRAQDLVDKQNEYGPRFSWDFIGSLQSRKVRDIAPRVRLIHSVASESVLRQLERYPAPEVLVEVNIANEQNKSGIASTDLGAFIDRCPVPVTGLMCMPPIAQKAEDSRPYFAALAQLAAEHGLSRLSMGTSQDYCAAVREGATIVRLGSVLYD